MSSWQADAIACEKSLLREAEDYAERLYGEDWDEEEDEEEDSVGKLVGLVEDMMEDEDGS